MGEYAEMMLDGTCCSQCGEFLGASEGHPVSCASCEAETDAFRVPHRKMGKATKALLNKMYQHKKQMEISGVVEPIYALRNRGYAERCARFSYWKLTAEGIAKAKELSAAATGERFPEMETEDG